MAESIPDSAVTNDNPGWTGAVIARSKERATRIERIMAAWSWKPWQLPWTITRRGRLERISEAFGTDAAADLLLCARLRILASLFSLFAGIFFAVNDVALVIAGGLFEVSALCAAVGARRRLRLSRVPIRRRFIARLVASRHQRLHAQ